MKNQRNGLGGQTARKQKSIDNTIRELLECGDLAAGQAAIARLAQRQKEAPSKTALRAALRKADWKTPELLPLLVSALLPHTDLNQRFAGGKTALMLAVERCVWPTQTPTHAAALETLRRLAAACDARAVDDRQQTALMLATTVRVHPSAIEIVLPISDPDAQDYFGRTALHLAALKHRGSQGRHHRAFELLLPCTTAKIANVLSLFEGGPSVGSLNCEDWTWTVDQVLCNPGLSLRRVKNFVARHEFFSLRKAKARLAAIEAAFEESRGNPRGPNETAPPAPETVAPNRSARRL